MADRKDRPVRMDHEQPEAVARFGWRYHHLGIPTNTPRPGEQYIPHLKVYVSGFETSPYGIQWMRFDEECPVHQLIRLIPHVAFEVDDLEGALEGKTLLGPITSPSAGSRKTTAPRWSSWNSAGRRIRRQAAHPASQAT